MNSAVAQDDVTGNAPGPAAFQESFSLPTEEAVVSQLEDVQAYIEKQRWEPAVDLLIRISQERGTALTPIRPGWYINVSRYCNLLLAALPRDGLTAYRKKIDRQAQAWLQEARDKQDERLLRRIVRHAFCSSVGDEAVMLLARRAWERGNVTTARRFWKLLLPRDEEDEDDDKSPAAVADLRYPDTSIPPADIRVRLILCDILNGDLLRAKQLLAEFGQRHPKARGRLAGRSGRYHRILQTVLNEATTWPERNPNGSFSTFAGNPARNGIAKQAPDVGVRRWRRKLHWRSLPGPETPGLHNAMRHPACFPVVWKDRVFVADAERIYGDHLDDGSPPFGVSTNGDRERRKSSEPSGVSRRVHRKPTAESRESKAADDLKSPLAAGIADSANVLYSTALAGESPLPTERTLGREWFSLTIHRGRLYARLGSPITGRATDETRAVRSRLVCLDLKRGEGKLLWKTASQSLGPGWEFEGSPVVSGDHLYMVLRQRSPETQIHVACFHAETGASVWQTRVGTAIAVGGENENHASHLLLTLAESRLFLSTNLGAVAALNARDGRLQWAVTYPSTNNREARRNAGDNDGAPTPPLFHCGVVYVAPADADYLSALDAKTGAVLWRRQLRGGVQHLVGLCALEGEDAERLVVSGNRLWGLDPQTGTIVWNVGFENPAGYGFGRGMIAGQNVFWPLRKEIIIADCRTGRVRRRIRLHRLQNGYGGNLIVVNNRLIVAEPERLVVYGTQPGRLP